MIWVNECIRPWKLRLNLVRMNDWKHKQKISSYLKLKVRIVIFKQKRLFLWILFGLTDLAKHVVWFSEVKNTYDCIVSCKQW